MNVRVGDIIKLENNQFVAVSKLCCKWTLYSFRVYGLFILLQLFFNCLLCSHIRERESSQSAPRVFSGAEIDLLAFLTTEGFILVLHTGRHPPPL